MRKRLFIIFIFIVSLFYNSEIRGYDWNKDDILATGNNGELKKIPKEDLSKYRSEEDQLKTIETVCLYQQIDRGVNSDSNLYDENWIVGNPLDYLKILFIYTDGTASIGYKGNDTACERNNGILSGVCLDGYTPSGGTVHRGIRNWSKNNDGVLDNLNPFYDAYTYYQETKECPFYLAHAENWKSNTFYLAINDNMASADTMDNLAKKDEGDKTYSYYNVEVNKNITSDFSCDYSYKEDDTSPLVTLNFVKNGFVTVQKGYDGRHFRHKSADNVVGDVYINSRMFSKTYSVEDGKCPKTLESCVHWVSTGWGGKSNIVIYGDPVRNDEDTYCKGDDSMTLHCIGENCSEKSMCQYYDDYYNQMSDLLDKYNDNSKNKSKQIEILSDYNKTKEILNSYCQSALSRMNYSPGNCVQKCIDSAKELSKLEIEKGFKSAPKKEKCNIGASILSMVYNVLKWAKYIAPILVIILSILDFIKAIAAQNDDDMKKAQGKFVKRLIVAALLFLLPLIINFMLKIFGLYSSKCDISDLFS